MLKNTAVGVAVIADRCEIGRFVFFRKVSAHGNGHGIAKDDCCQERQNHIAKKGIGAAADRQMFDTPSADQTGDGV